MENKKDATEKPFTHVHTLFHKHKILAVGIMAVSLLVCTALVFAAQTPTSATLNGGSSVTVAGSASITADVIGTLTSGSTWRGTRWRISTTAPGTTTCANTTDYTSNGTGLDSGNFTITAPSSSGTYNAYFIMDSSNTCGGTTGSTLTMTGAVVVDATAPTFTMQYYSDAGLTTSLGNNPRLKAGTYYVKITSSEALSAAPTVSFAAEGTANDVTNAATTLVSGNDYKYTRVISNDAAAVGNTVENISVSGTDLVGNTATNVNPTNEGTKAAYTDTNAPTVSGVSSTSANGTYGLGSLIPVTVTFSENVTVTGTPQLTLATGSPASTALNYSSGSGTSTLTFNYTVADGNSSSDLDYVGTTSLSLNGGTLQDGAGNNAVLTLAAPGASGSLGANKNIVIDSVVHNPGTMADDSSIGTLTWTTVNNAKTSDDAYATLTSSTSNGVTHYLKATNFGYSIPAGSTINGIQVEVERNESGTTLRVSDNSVRLVKQGTIIGDNKSTGTNWPTSDAYITYGGSGDVWGTTWTADDINAATTGFVISAKHDSSTSSRDFNVDHIRMKVFYTPDTTAPTVSGVTSSLADGTYLGGQVVPVEVNFSENVNVTGTPQLTISTGSPSTTVLDYTGGSGTSTLTFNYTVAAGNYSADLDYAGTTSLALNGGTIKDGAGNNAVLTLASPGAAGSLGANKNLVIDAVAPTLNPVTIASDNADPSLAKSGDTVTVSFTSSENIQTPTVTIDGVGATVLGGPTVWTAGTVMTPGNTEGALAFNISFTDIAGNSGTAVTSTTDLSAVTFDNTPPTVVSLTSTASPGPTNTSPIPMSVTFSEPVTDLTEGDFTVGNGSVDFGSLAGGPTAYTFTVTPSAPPGPQTVTVDLNTGTVKDLAGNNNVTPASQFSIVFDSANPTTTISSTVSDPTNVSPIPVTVTFSQDVTGFDNTDVVVGNGVLSNFNASSASVYTFDVTPSGQGAVTVDVAGGVAMDAATNPNLAATQFSVTYDTIAPSVIDAKVKDRDGDGTMDRIVLTFDEALANTPSGSNGFDVTSAADHGLCHSETANPNGTDTLNVDFVCANTYTAIGDLTLTLTPNPGVVDAAGNQSSATLTGTSTPPLIDKAKPVVLSTTPADSAVGAPYNADVVVNFSEPMKKPSFTISDDDTNTYGTPVWSNGNMTVTVPHDNWTFDTFVTVTVDAKDKEGLSLGGAGTYSWGFTSGNDSHEGHITVPTTFNVNDNGSDLSNGVNTASGGNLMINGTSQPLNNVTDGDLAGQDLSVAHTVGDVSVTPAKDVTLNSTSTVIFQNTGISNVAAMIPNNTTVYGCNTWDGTMVMKAGSSTGTAPSGFSVGNSVYEIGSANCPLLLSQPVTIVLAGVTGDVGYKPAGSGNWFTVPACAGTYAVPTPPPAPAPFTECAISDGANTKIVTYHFTTFGGLTTTGGAGGSSVNTAEGGGSAGIVEQLGMTQSQATQQESRDSGESKTDETARLHKAAEQTCERTGTTPVPLNDIANSPEKSSIEKLYRECVIDGSGNTYLPQNPVTKAEMAKMVIRKFNLGVSAYEDMFGDVTEQNPAAPYLLQAVKLEILHGQSVNHMNGVFLRPDVALTRAEALYMILKAKGMKLDRYNLKAEYADISPDDWFYKTAAVAQNNGLLADTDVHFAKLGKASKYYRFPRLLGLNNMGEDVRQLKLLMAQLDYYSGTIDTHYGEDLSDAVKVYQKARKLLPTGSMGSVTRTKLLNEYLHSKVTKFFKPYALVSRAEAARLIELASNIPAGGEVLGVSRYKLQTLINAIGTFFLSIVNDHRNT